MDKIKNFLINLKNELNVETPKSQLDEKASMPPSQADKNDILGLFNAPQMVGDIKRKTRNKEPQPKFTKTENHRGSQDDQERNSEKRDLRFNYTQANFSCPLPLAKKKAIIKSVKDEGKLHKFTEAHILHIVSKQTL